MLDTMTKMAEKYIEKAIQAEDWWWKRFMAGAFVYTMLAIAYAIAKLADAMRQK